MIAATENDPLEANSLMRSGAEPMLDSLPTCSSVLLPSYSRC